MLRLLTELMERVRVVEALSNVPQMYCLAVVEVVRRKLFMRHYREVRAASPSPAGGVCCPVLPMLAVANAEGVSCLLSGRIPW